MNTGLKITGKSLAAVAFLLFAISAFGQANLQPYAPSGWSFPLVVTTNSSSTNQSPTMNTANTLYIDWCVANLGNAASGTFTLNLYVDGVLNQGFAAGPVGVSSYTYLTGYSIGALSAGTHAIVMTISANNVSYTNTITVTAGPPPLPNLTPYQVSGWSSPLVVTTNGSSVTQSPTFTSTNPIYVDWAVINDGSATAGASTTALSVDGVQVNSWSTPSLPVSSYTFVTNYSIGTLTAGTHTIVITANSGNTVTESDYADNSYTNTITVTAISIPAPTLVTPANTATSQSTTPGFTWSAVTGVTGYRIIVATSAADLPTSPNASSGGPSVAIDAITTNNAYTNTVPLVPSTTYYWEVHGRGGGGDNGNWSSVFSFTTAASPAGLTIIPTFASSITSDPQAAAIESTIKAAIAVYQSNFSDPITVNITFTEMSDGLGLNNSQETSISYASYRAALAAHATTADDNTALAYLPNVTDNPVTGDPNLEVKLPLARALGFSANPPEGQPDGTVYLNTSIMNLSGATSISTNYALFSVVSHEMDEVLALSSILNGVTNGQPVPTGPADPEDLFRYNAAGARTLSTAANTNSYFSLDGTTDLAQFNQEQGGDFQDWYSYYGGVTPQVQDAYATAGASPVLGVELRVLDALGLTRVVQQFTMVASAGSGGSVSPSGSFSKNVGTSQSFTATPDGTHFVNQWLVDSAVVQTGGTNYTLANIQTNHTVQVTFTAKTNQTITFGPLPSHTYGDPPFPLVATASSGLPVSFSIASGPATLAGTNLVVTGLGTVTVQASQAGNATYNAAANVNQSFVIYSAPSLQLTGAGTNLVIAWTTNVAGFTLLETTNLANAASWQPVTPSPANVNGQYVVTNTFSGKSLFYRLQK